MSKHFFRPAISAAALAVGLWGAPGLYAEGNDGAGVGTPITASDAAANGAADMTGAGDANSGVDANGAGDGLSLVPRDVEFDPSTVTASGFNERVFESPYSVYVVGQEQIDRRLYRTIPQALRDVPGLMIQETSVGQGSPYIRGFTGFRNLFLIDGIRLNNSVFREGPNQYWNTVDLQMLQRIEVVKGPTSVLYGSDAIGGTVNVITRDPYPYGQGLQTGGRGFYRFSSAEESHTARGEISLTLDNDWGAIGGVTYRNFGDLRTGDGLQENTGYAEWNGDFKVEHFLTEKVRIVAAHQIMRQNNVPRTHATVFADTYAGTTRGSDLQRDLDQERQLFYVQLHGEELDEFVREFHVSFSWHRQGENQDRIRSSGARQITGLEVNTFGVYARAISDTPIGELSYGIDYYRDWVSSFSNTNAIQGPVADDSTYDLLGLFISNRIPVGEMIEITLGGRLTYVAVDADSVNLGGTRGSIEEEWWNFSGNARVAIFIDPDKHWNVFGGVSQGFRAPNLSDLTRDAEFGGGTEQPAIDLDPEQFIMFEIGVKGQYENLTVQAAVFHYILDDQILRVPSGDGDIFNKINSDQGYIQGVEVGFAWRFHDDWTLFGNASWADGEQESVRPDGTFFDDYPSRIQPFMGQLGVRFQPQGAPFWVEGIVRGAAEAGRLSQRDQGDTQRIPPGGTPGWAIVSVRGGVDLNEHFTLTAAVENILDTDYRVHGSGQNSPGANFIFAIEGRW